MQAMKAKNAIIAALILVVAFLSYRVRVHRAERRDEIEFRLLVDKAMYEASQRGNLQKVKDSTSILLLGDVRDYERRFGVPSGTNRFARDFATAQAMAQSIESELVPVSSIATNSAIVSKFGSNVAITVEPER